MSEQLTEHNQITAQYDNDGYKALVSEFSIYLKTRGYCEGTQLNYRSALTHLVRWLSVESEYRMIDGQTVRAFLQNHLPACHCPPPVFRELRTVRAALNQLLLMQGQDRLHPPCFKGSVAVEDTIHQFDDFQRDVCGLAEATLLRRRNCVRAFLSSLFSDGPIDPQSITPEALLKFVTDKATDLKPSSVGSLLCALRSYLRFLQFKGESNITLIDAVPSPPNWSLASLPPSLSKTDMDRFWAAFDTTLTNGKRDYAMARCLADLGLRCHEVASMRLDDIDWQNGVLQLYLTKSRRQDQLPLPDITGRAIVDYLRNSRPTTTSQSMFVYHRAPLGQGVAVTTVHSAICSALARAGLRCTGTHILRHTAATLMVQGGATIKEVADVLRHRSINTTAIYTKVNLPELQRVAMPWPGRLS
ncbi:MAG: tyrosine-type recombinase/integrase [Gammaproteobacteria bacterium]|nr:tyrosine-type recombinase/integrase [Gammaproteobacteria bacterium]